MISLVPQSFGGVKSNLNSIIAEASCSRTTAHDSKKSGLFWCFSRFCRTMVILYNKFGSVIQPMFQSAERFSQTSEAQRTSKPSFHRWC